MHNVKTILFWEGFPACGLLLKEVIKKYSNDLIIVATRAAVPFEGLETLLGHEIFWIDNPNDISSYFEKFSDRNLVIHTGWVYKEWLNFDKYLKNRNNAKVVVVVDNHFKKNLRQFLGAFYFRAFLKKYFDAVLVPGRSGVTLMRFLGMSKNRIYTGNYGAYEKLYFDNTPIIERKSEFLYVGQLTKRKSIDILLEGFRKYKHEGGSWGLRLLGSGDMYDECNKHDDIICEGFTQPHKVAEKMNQAKVLVLISREDHWGTVVCEAAACGMHLILSAGVGSSVDMLRSGVNGIELPSLNSSTLADTFHFYESMPVNQLLNGSEVSKGIARGYDSMSYFSAFEKIIRDLALEEKSR